MMKSMENLELQKIDIVQKHGDIKWALNFHNIYIAQLCQQKQCIQQCTSVEHIQLEVIFAKEIIH